LNWQNYNRIGNPHYLASTSGRCRRAEHNIKEVINLDEYSLSVKDVVWSVAVQHGSSSGVIKKALHNIDLKKASEKEIIEAIYAERGRKNAKGILVYFSSSSLNVQKNIAERYKNEENEAISKL
jgi:hypothetical protein